jgi:hypothetical protein
MYVLTEIHSLPGICNNHKGGLQSIEGQRGERKTDFDRSILNAEKTIYMHLCLVTRCRTKSTFNDS